MLLAVTECRLVAPYTLLLTFNDGTAKQVDLAEHWARLSGPIYQPLRDPTFFAQVTLLPDSETIEWPNGADLAAEFLYEIGEPVVLQSTTPHWATA